LDRAPQIFYAAQFTPYCMTPAKSVGCGCGCGFVAQSQFVSTSYYS